MVLEKNGGGLGGFREKNGDKKGGVGVKKFDGGEWFWGWFWEKDG